jgi:general secretion pathway protein M
MQSVQSAWQARSPRERLVLGVGAVVLTLLLLYHFVWEPLEAERERLRRSIGALRTQAAQFDEDAAEAELLRNTGKERPRSASNHALLQEAAERVGARSSIKSITEVADGRMQVVLEPLPYATLVKWIGAIMGSGAVTIDAIQVKTSGTPGSVQVDSLVLKVAQP